MLSQVDGVISDTRNSTSVFARNSEELETLLFALFMANDLYAAVAHFVNVASPHCTRARQRDGHSTELTKPLGRTTNNEK